MKQPFFTVQSSSTISSLTMTGGKSRKASSSTLDLQTRLVDGKEYVPEPPFMEEKTKVWESQVINPFYLEGKPLAFLGPLPTEAPSTITIEDNEAFFPTSTFTKPIVSVSKTLTLCYVDRNFRIAHPLNCPKFNTWMKRLEPKKMAKWKDLGIPTLLELSCYDQPYSCGMLLAAIHFWEGSTNTFHTKCGMITVTPSKTP